MIIVVHQHLNAVDNRLVIPVKIATDLHVGVVNPIDPVSLGEAVTDHLTNPVRQIAVVVLRQRNRTDTTDVPDLSAIVVHAAKVQGRLAKPPKHVVLTTN